MKNCLLSFTVILILVAAMLCATALADTDGTDGELRWRLDDAGTLTVSGSGDMLPYYREDRGAQ